MAFNSPAQVIDGYADGSIGKAKSPIWRLFVLGVAAGALVSFGAVASSTAAHQLADAGMVRMVTGLIFPLGLIMIVLLGAELFTGNCLMIAAVLQKKITWGGLLRNWVVVYIGNFVGAIIVAACAAFFGQLDIGAKALAVYTAKVAASKAALPWVNAFVLGIGCNVMVCVAVLLGSTAQDTAGRILGLFFPVMGFAMAGFEHCVANMYYVPAGIFAFMNPSYTQLIIDAGINTDVLNFGAFIANNLVPVTLGNIVGGVAVGIIMYAAHGARAAK